MLDMMVDANERILWLGKPNRLLYTIGNPITYIIACIWLFFDLFFIRQISSVGGTRLIENGFSSFFLLFFAVHLFPVWIAVFGPIYRFFAWSVIEYAVTSRRVYIVSGLIGRDIQSLELFEVQELSVNVSVLERMQNSGTIRLTPDVSTGRGKNRSTKAGQRFMNIPEPYDVYSLIKRAALDITTDVNYPNAYRPAENPGYNTSYQSKPGPNS